MRFAESEGEQFTGLYERPPVQRALGEAIRKGRLPRVGDVGGAAQSVGAPGDEDGPSLGELLKRNLGIATGIGVMFVPLIYFLVNMKGGK